ncbi:Hemin transport system permease protein HmuU [Sedimentisphaera cyanobacteriorum]|uniref:Hemin transport system permease protein HmuU n=1 Tax=Sedimentisphaera cyanobacteriorum TaxID=1940790 RepID=A0A1Q2HR55_9BACT|nr:iron ABC transporter permease [Sedimentisphaera cyanobacteriorum]AQQ09880.1 Hemin transport system permease protein HmuU [Sedimentisphaera cyanobacteriorum]
MTRKNIIAASSCGFCLYLLFAITVILFCPLVGAESLDIKLILQDIRGGNIHQIDTDIFIYQRLPRVLLAFITGAALAVAGNTFQIILRNPLVTPYTLGVTGGSAVGAYLAIAFPAISGILGKAGSVQLMSMAGAGVIGLLIYTASRRKAGLSMYTMLLAGVTISIMCGAFIILIRYLTKPHLLVSLDRWTMGRLDIVGFDNFYSIIPLVVIALAMIGYHVRSLNHISLGDEMAMGHGVDVACVQKYCFIGGSIATAAVVSAAGPIGFIGLIVPHVTRKISGFDNRIVMFGCFCLGGAFLVLCDAIARTLIAPTEIPVGVITALIGGPCFIYLLIKR